jgi:hypothetical protein
MARGLAVDPLRRLTRCTNDPLRHGSAQEHEDN